MIRCISISYAYLSQTICDSRLEPKDTTSFVSEVQAMNFHVVMEAAWLVRDVESVDDAIGVAVSEAGGRLNDVGLEYVEVEVGVTGCPACEEPFDAAFMAAETAIVGLMIEMEVFNAESEEHAARIAKSEVGQALKNVPLTILETVPTEE